MRGQELDGCIIRDVGQHLEIVTYSHSRLATFTQCALKYRFRYVDDIPTQRESIEAFAGKRVHNVIEKLYRDLWDGRLNRNDELRDFYAFRWEEEWHQHVHVARAGETVDDHFSYGLDCIDNFYRENHPFNQSRTVMLEEKVEFNLDPGGWRRFQGYIDRVASRPDGTYEIHDYKTSRSRRSPGTSELRQLSMYQVGVQSMHPEVRNVELVSHFLCTGEVFRRQQAQTDLVKIVQDAHQLIDDIESERWFRANVTPLCNWCEFQEVCPACSF
ncbi:MAG TPA: PD-(D/E)XK nuclease family protein [Candidatus Sulfotelmatobacter sp.]|jgi:putative RecB family exonuclease|nr:PD-(D/E)XK nuclease family protein [Candidatus Sulfotelmatobacter sp.]